MEKAYALVTVRDINLLKMPISTVENSIVTAGVIRREPGVVVSR